MVIPQFTPSERPKSIVNCFFLSDHGSWTIKSDNGKRRLPWSDFMVHAWCKPTLSCYGFSPTTCDNFLSEDCFPSCMFVVQNNVHVLGWNFDPKINLMKGGVGKVLSSSTLRYKIHKTMDHHNLIQIHNNVMWDGQHSTKYSLTFSTFKFEVGKYHEIFCGILSVP